MIENKKVIRYPRCGKNADVIVHADGMDDTPGSFTMQVTCSGSCEKVTIPMTPEEMHEHNLGGYPLSGWDETRY